MFSKMDVFFLLFFDMGFFFRVLGDGIFDLLFWETDLCFFFTSFGKSFFSAKGW